MSEESKLKANISKAVEAQKIKAPPPPAPRAPIAEKVVVPQAAVEKPAAEEKPAHEDPAAKYLNAMKAQAAEPAAEAAPSTPAASQGDQPPKPTAVPVTVDNSRVRSNASALDLMAALSSLKKVRAGYSVVMLHSGYKAEMTALSFQEIAALQTTITDAHAARLKMLRIVLARMSSPSVAMDENRFLNGTTESDLNTLLFGIYASTYPGKNDYTVRCRHCGVENTCVHTPNELIRIRGEEVYATIEAILASDGDKEQATRDAPINKSISVQLPTTGVIVEICDPSLQETLRHIDFFQKKIDPKTGEARRGTEGYDTLVELAVHIKRILLPSGGGLLPVTDLEAKIQAIGSLPQEDGKALTDALAAEIKRLAVEFRVPDFNCAKCKKTNDDLFLNFERVLFDKMAR